MASRRGRGGRSSAVARTSHRPYIRKVVIRFRDHISLPSDRDVAIEIESRAIGPWTHLASLFDGIAISPLFRSQSPAKILELVARATSLDPSYRPARFLNYFGVTVPAGVDPNALVHEFSSWPAVALAYVQPPPNVPPMVNAADDPRSVDQQHLHAAPGGIDADYAWQFPGGDGTGQALIDLEQGWNFNHEDLAALGIAGPISGDNRDFIYHGTRVLGVVAATDNTVGGIGIAPAVPSVRCVSQWRADGSYDTAEPIFDAIAVMAYGDVLLLEAQTDLWGLVKLPVEAEQAVFDAIALATALGIVVVEAAGNGGHDLDGIQDPNGNLVFDRAFRDSGAIIVASAFPRNRRKLADSCFGRRVDCYAWGQGVDTADTDDLGTVNDLYTGYFDGTSSASAIVAGAALVVQGLTEAGPRAGRFSPREVRSILADKANGTESANGEVDKIGYMPDLRKIIDSEVLNLTPDVYLRDFVGDLGAVHTDSISASPDVILQDTPVADPQGTFGEGSGTENSSTLGSTAVAGQDNYIYARVRNRGASDATNVTITIYWAPSSTLVMPDLWTLVGSTVIAAVPAGDILTVSSAIVWPAAAVPARGHYCFVAIVGHALDPAPVPAHLRGWDDFWQYIRGNNNVTWRNFNVVFVPAWLDAATFVELPFMMAGPPDEARAMRLEVIGRLPAGARAFLDLPPDLATHLRTGFAPFVRPGREGVVRVPVNPAGLTRFGDVELRVGTKIALRLLVNVPPKLRRFPFEICARQMAGRQEVGRVTWRLVPQAEPRKRTGYVGRRAALRSRADVQSAGQARTRRPKSRKKSRKAR